MNPVLRVLKNSTALALSVLIEQGVAFLLPWYIARIQGKKLWGYYSTALTFVTIASTFAYWGLDQLLPREIARDRQRAGTVLASATLIGGVVSLLAMLIMTGIVHLLDYPTPVRQLIFWGIFGTLLPKTEATLCEATVNGLEKMEWVIAVRFPLTVLRIATSILLLSCGFGLNVLFIMLAVYYLLAWGAYLGLFRRYLPDFHWQFDRSLTQLLTRQAIPFASVIFIGETFKQVDRVFLSKLWDTDTVGIYSAGAMLVQIIYLLAPAVMTSLFPGLSRMYTVSCQRFSEMVSRLLKFIFVGIFPVVLTIVALAQPIILLLFGQEYSESIQVLQILALGIAPSFVARLLYRALLASNNEHLAVRVAFTNSAFNVGLNILLIPRYGVLGASISAVCTGMVGLGQNLYYISRGIVRIDFTYSLLRPLLVALSSLALCLVLMQWNIAVAWLASVAIFLGITLVSRTITWKELHTLFLARS